MSTLDTPHEFFGILGSGFEGFTVVGVCRIWGVLFFASVVMVWVLSGVVGVGGFGVLRGWG